jgi:DNA helicase-2/ATP-dependent DNA helicase PcrA
VLPALGVEGVRVATFETWAIKELRHAVPWLDVPVVDEAPPQVRRLKSHPALLHELQRRARAYTGKRTSRAVVALWADLLTDRGLVREILGGTGELTEVNRYLEDRASAVVDRDPAQGREKEVEVEDQEIRGATGIDGQRTDDAPALLDLEDVAILLRAHQLLRGSKRLLSHLFVDEAQDLSPLELSVLLGQMTSLRSVTLAGDTAQRLFLDNGFDDWRSVLRHLDLAHVAIEPLRIAYRSTREILALGRHVMGPLADAEPPAAPRTGAPVEAHAFPGTGAAVAFVAEALRSLLQRESRASVAVLARHAEQADRYYDGLRRAEVPALRRVRAQEFSFRPGIEVTEISQVKGLEFDYVIIVDANASTFGLDAESRHLLHIAATRAAHQLWLIVTGPPSPLLPPELVDPAP